MRRPVTSAFQLHLQHRPAGRGPGGGEDIHLYQGQTHQRREVSAWRKRRTRPVAEPGGRQERDGLTLARLYGRSVNWIHLFCVGKDRKDNISLGLVGRLCVQS